MLQNISIKNFAIIESTEMDFSKGLNIISGETGSGKSIILKALSSIIGDKLSGEYIRKGADVAEMQASFSIKKNGETYKILSDEHMLHDDDESFVVIRKLVKRDQNRDVTKIWINGVSCTNQLLIKVSKDLIQALSQHQHQKLTTTNEQLKIIDASVDKNLIKELQTELTHLRSAEAELSQLQKDATFKDDKISYAQHRLKELEGIDLEVDDKELEDKIALLENSQFFMEEIAALESIIHEEGVLDKITQLRRRLMKITQKHSQETFSQALQTVESVLKQINDVSEIIESSKTSLSFDEEELPLLMEKAKVIKRLKNKFGSIDKIKEHRVALDTELEYLTNLDKDIITKENLLKKHKANATKLASEISKKRKEIAGVLENKITQELQTLNMKGASFKIDFQTQELSQHGLDQISFLIASNKGEDHKPLGKIASGGELSRIMLAIHKSMNSDGNNTFLLDEVDQGISGNTGTIIGQKLAELAKKNQIIAITHLPQVASFADKHFLIEKQEIKKTNRVISVARELTGEEKELEIARLVGGSATQETALRHARELIKSSGK